VSDNRDRVCRTATSAADPGGRTARITGTLTHTTNWQDTGPLTRGSKRAAVAAPCHRSDDHTLVFVYSIYQGLLQNGALIVVYTLIVLVLRSPLEDPLSAKRVIRTERRVQAFVMLAIAVFVAGGFAANRYVTAAHIRPPSAPPVRDAVVAPTPEGSVVKPHTRAPSPKATAHRPKTRTSPSRASRTRTHPAAAPPAKVMTPEDAALRLTNAQRAKHGCTALRSDPRLRTAARLHSADMRLWRYFDHNSLDGATPWDRIKAAGYSTPGAENIAQGYPTAQAVVLGWMNSPDHRANILNCSLKAVGIGVAYGQGGPWWTQDFGYR
jgi:uncharacterized protein YkwD